MSQISFKTQETHLIFKEYAAHIFPRARLWSPGSHDKITYRRILIFEQIDSNCPRDLLNSQS